MEWRQETSARCVQTVSAFVAFVYSTHQRIPELQSRSRLDLPLRLLAKDGGISARPSWEKVGAILDEAESSSLSPTSRMLVTAKVASASASRLSTAASAILSMSA